MRYEHTIEARGLADKSKVASIPGGVGLLSHILTKSVANVLDHPGVTLIRQPKLFRLSYRAMWLAHRRSRKNESRQTERPFYVTRHSENKAPG